MKRIAVITAALMALAAPAWASYDTGWYAYTAITFLGDRVLLGHVAGDRNEGKLSTTQITSFDVKWLYEE